MIDKRILLPPAPCSYGAYQCIEDRIKRDQLARDAQQDLCVMLFWVIVGGAIFISLTIGSLIWTVVIVSVVWIGGRQLLRRWLLRESESAQQERERAEQIRQKYTQYLDTISSCLEEATTNGRAHSCTVLWWKSTEFKVAIAFSRNPCVPPEIQVFGLSDVVFTNSHDADVPKVEFPNLQYVREGDSNYAVVQYGNRAVVTSQAPNPSYPPKEKPAIWLPPGAVRP